MNGIKGTRDEILEKEANYANPQVNQADCLTGKIYHPSTIGEQAEKNAAHHFEQAQKMMSAANFLKSHPEFDEFIRLIRSGALQF